MKSIYGAPSTGVPLADDETAWARSGEPYSEKTMTELLLRLTDMEQHLKNGDGGRIDYDYSAFREEGNIFTEGSIVHVLRHLRYDRHEVHAHAFFEIICQLSGTASLTLGDSHETLSEGEICFVAPQMPHRIYLNEDDAITLKIILRRSDFDEMYRQLLRRASVLSHFFRSALYGEGAGWLCFDTAGDAEIRAVLFRMRWHEVRAAMTDDMMKQALIMQLFCLLTERCIDRTRAASSAGIEGRVLAYIAENYRTVTLDELSEVFHFSGDYLSRIVKRAAGKSFSDVVIGMKLERACTLLDTTDLPVEQVALACGFGCREFFYKTFRRTLGMPPAKWRKRENK